jgi:serine/threonine protein phosphatase PrpC
MAINNYLKSLDLPECNDALLAEFIKTKQDDLHNYVLKLWDDFKTSNQPLPVMDQSNSTEQPTSSPVATEMADEPYFEPQPEPTESILPDGNTQPISDTNNTNTPPQMSNTRGDAPSNTGDRDNQTFDLQIKSKNIMIPNGKVNQPYLFSFRFDELALTDVADYWFEGIDTLGLTFDADTNQIKGTPLVAGDHKIKLKIKRNDWCEGKPIFERDITLIINPDPKSLWKNIPTPIDIEYYKPDSDKQYLKVEATHGILGFGKRPRKDMVAASQRGRSHAQEGKPRDDDFSLKYIKDSEWYVMAVADGAGSAAASRKGAQIACQTVANVCEQKITSHLKEFEQHIKNFHSDNSSDNRKKVGDNLYHIVGNAVFTAFKNIDAEARVANKPLKDFSTTLIVSICKKFKFGWFVGAFWVGDGGIGIYNHETGFLKVLGETDGGEYAGQTRFLTMPEITQPAELYRRLRFDIVEDFTALILMSDGVTDPKFETDANLLKIDKWNNLWTDITQSVNLSDDNQAAADELLNWLDFWSPGNHDDRTIAILY